MSCLEKLKAFACLPVAAVAWLSGYISTLPEERRETPTFMVQQLLSFGSTPPGGLTKDFSKLYSDRTRAATRVIARLHLQLSTTHVANFEIGATPKSGVAAETAPSSKNVGGAGLAPGSNADVMRNLFNDSLERGWLTTSAAYQLERLSSVSGPDWFATAATRLLLDQFYHNDLQAAANALAAWFRLDQERLTISLLSKAIPRVLESPNGFPSSSTEASSSSMPGIQNPHARALARLAVTCTVATFVDREASGTTSSHAIGSPSMAKRRRLDVDAQRQSLSSFLASDVSASSCSFDNDAAVTSTEDSFLAALDELHAALLDVVEGGVVDARLLFIVAFFNEALETSYADRILGSAPVRLFSRLLSTAPTELTASKVGAMTDIDSGAGRAVAAALLHAHASVLR